MMTVDDNEKGDVSEIRGENSLSTSDLLTRINENIKSLRDEQRKSVLRVYETEPDLYDKSSGDVFIESVGTILHLENGDFQHLYNREAILARDKMVFPAVRDRRKMFEALAAQFDTGSRVLNIGAGGDTVPINAFKLAGHDVVNTDFSREVTDELSRRTDTPVFAVDLVNLNKVMPEKSVDYLIGNSTLGYLEPNKLKKVVENLCMVMKKGGVFTFDMLPHAIYTRIFEGGESQTVVNESEVDPVKLLDFVRRYGPNHGINAMGRYHNMKSAAIQLAVMDILKDLFESQGFQAGCGYYESNIKEVYQSKILRVWDPAAGDALSELVGGETRYKDLDERWSVLTGKMDKLIYCLICLDRQNAASLAKCFGIEGNPRALPYLVAEHVLDNQNPASLPAEISEEVTKSIHPALIRDAIKPYMGGKKVMLLKPMPMAVQTDQILHKFVMSGQAPFDVDEVEARIDAAYQDPKLAGRLPDRSISKDRPLIQRNGFKAKKKRRK